MDRLPDSPAPQVTTPQGDERPDTGRRRFIVGAALAAAPLIITLTARPAEARQGTLGTYASTPQ